MRELFHLKELVRLSDKISQIVRDIVNGDDPWTMSGTSFHEIAYKLARAKNFTKTNGKIVKFSVDQFQTELVKAFEAGQLVWKFSAVNPKLRIALMNMPAARELAVNLRDGGGIDAIIPTQLRRSKKGATINGKPIRQRHRDMQPVLVTR